MKLSNPTLEGTPIRNIHPKSNVHAILAQITLDDAGYVARVRCGKNHSGNHLLAGPTNGFYCCSGCGEFFCAEQILTAQRNPSLGGEIGNGGLIARL